MLWSAIGSQGWTALGIAAIALPIQVATASMLAMGRRVPASAALVLPAIVLCFGLAGVVGGYDEAVRALRQMPDPAYAPWFAVVDRARAAAPVVAAAWAAVVLLTIPAIGAALGGLRADKRGVVGPLLAASAGMVAAVGLVGGAFALHPVLALPGLAVGILSLAAAAAAAGTRPGRGTAAAAGGAALAMAAISLVLAIAGVGEFGISTLFPDLDSPFTYATALPAALDDTRAVVIVGAIGLAGAAVGALPGVLFVRPRVLDSQSGLDFLGILVTFLVLLMGAAWAWARRHALTRLAGAYAMTMVGAAPGYDVPRAQVVPPRVFVADVQPRWLTLREGGGVDVEPFVGELNTVSDSLRRGDGLVLPPSMTMIDAYLLLAGAEIGEVALVGCEFVSEAEREKLRQDPLRAVGRCGAFPLPMRVVETLTERRTLIVLKDRELDDGGEIVAVGDLQAVEGKDVILRAQADATVADLVATLQALGGARRVYLGWGVDLDGTDIPVGVDPDLWVEPG